MWVIECTLTACTTRRAKPWPSESSQNAGVRSASRAVKSRSRVSARICCVVSGVFGGRPSTVRPWSSGRRLISIASGRPTTIAITPEANEVARQP